MNATPADRQSLFERLCLLRALYARRGNRDRDRDGAMTIAEAMRYAESLFTRSAASTV